MYERLAQREIVLLGAGHTNAHVLRMWRMHRPADVRLTCISDFAMATYSGMLPGLLAGQYESDEMHIDLVRFTAAVGARLIRGTVTGLDRRQRHVVMDDRPPVPYDLLSIGIGSVPRVDAGVVENGDDVLMIKPMQTFLERLDERLRRWSTRAGRAPLRVVVVGGGAAGVEIAMCLPARLRCVLDAVDFELTLVESGARLVAGLPQRAAEIARRVLLDRGAHVELHCEVRRVDEDRVVISDGRELPADLVIWSTGAAAPPLLSRFDLATDERGFLLTRPTLQTVTDDRVFAVGDTGTLAEGATPKAGVYAVRHGPVLWQNLNRYLQGQPLLDYKPQRGFLTLLNSGDGQAILSYKGRSTRGHWCWRLKDFIDSRFMDKYHDYEPGGMTDDNVDAEQQPMRCGGCGGKIGSSVLARAFERLDVPASDHVLVGMRERDDAALIRTSDGHPLAVSVDFFTAPLDDAYLVGRIAALNAASDLFALGSRPLAALAVATIPSGTPRQQEQMLYELLAGGLFELRKMGATLAGGHTIEGAETTIGYTVLAAQDGPDARLKAHVREGDALLLTKPLGTGVLLAGHALARCKAAWMQGLLDTMLASNQQAAGALADFDVTATTDVTGFGLAGHLLEMLRASRVDAEIRMADLPLLDGFCELASGGVASSLDPANRAAAASIEGSDRATLTPRYTALFDPQTNGGLLIAVRDDRAEALVNRLVELGYPHAAVIGSVVRCRGEEPRLRLV